MFAEFHRHDTGRSVLLNPAGVLLVWEETRVEPATIVLTTGERVEVREHYSHVSARLHEAAQSREAVA